MDQTTIQSARIAYIEALWHHDIVSSAWQGFNSELDQQGLTLTIDRFQVPGSLEIPLQAKLLAESHDYSLIIAAGFIVDGGIYRHDFVASTVLDAMMRVQLDTGIPVLSIVLTPHQFQETDSHIDFFRQHLVGKGREAARAAAQTLTNLAQLKSSERKIAC